MADIPRVTEVLYLFKGAIGLAYRNAPGLVCVENVFKILCAHPLNVHGLTTCEGLQGIWSTSRGSQKSFIYLRVQSGLLIAMHQDLCVLKMCLRYFVAHLLKCSWSHNLSTRDGGKERGKKKGPMGEEPGENFTWGGLISKRSSNQIARTFPHN